MRYSYSFILFLSSAYLLSQVGIGTDSPQTSLDVKGINFNNITGAGSLNTKDGITFPSVTDLNVNGSTNGQMVYLNQTWMTNPEGLYVWKSSTWQRVNLGGNEDVAIPVGTTLQRPTTPSQGSIRFNTTLNKFEGFDGTNWIELN